jgi:hypothetical protein
MREPTQRQPTHYGADWSVPEGDECLLLLAQPAMESPVGRAEGRAVGGLRLEDRHAEHVSDDLADVGVGRPAAGDEYARELPHADVGGVQAHGQELALYDGAHIDLGCEGVYRLSVGIEAEEAARARRRDLDLLEEEADLAVVP